MIDIMATCVDISGAEYPEKISDQMIKPLEGKSLMPLFKNQAFEREALYWEHEGNRAVRMGDWKLVAKGQIRDRTQPVTWELYNIAKDRNENKNLIEQEAARAEKMKAMWQTYAHRANVFPCPIKPKKNQKAKPKANQKSEAKKPGKKQ